jgi:uncharacterized damage-inducible protein DinB
MIRKASDEAGVTNLRAPRPLRLIEKPSSAEYPAYAHIYIDLLPDDGLVLQHLQDNLASTREFIESIPAASLLHRYSEGKWSIKEILSHVADDERIYVYRALRFARNDSTELPGFDQDHYARYAEANGRDVTDLLDELTLVRQATIAFFNSLEDAALIRTGVANGHRSSVRALASHIAGHELRHRNIVKERYLKISLATVPVRDDPTHDLIVECAFRWFLRSPSIRKGDAPRRSHEGQLRQPHWNGTIASRPS